MATATCTVPACRRSPIIINLFLSPGRRLVGRLSFFRKFLLVGLLFLVPLVASLSTLVLLRTEGIERAQRERDGMQLIAPLRQTIQALQIHRGSSQIVIGGRPDAMDKVDEAARRVAESLAASMALDAAMTDRYGLQSIHTGIESDWENIRGKTVTVSARESFDLHSTLIRDVLGHIANVADKTGLSLDPEVETSYLARALYDFLLNAGESAGAMRAIGSRALTLGEMTAEERIHIRLLLDDYRQNMTRAMAAFDKANAANPALAGQIKTSFDHLSTAYGVYSEEIKSRLFETEKPQGDPKAYFETATRAIDAVFVLWDVAVGQLDGRIEQRIEQLRHDLFVNILLAAIAIGLSLYLLVAFMQSVNRQIAIIQEGTDRIARGDFSHAIASDDRNELGEICRQLDRVRIQLAAHIEADRQTAEESALREATVQSSRRLRTILDNLGEGIYVLDPEGRLTYLNAAGEALLGWRFAELEGKAVHDIIHYHTPDGRPLPAAACPIHLSMLEGHIYRSDNEVFFGKDGTALPVAVTGAPLLLDDNRMGSVAAFRDMRAQRLLIDSMAEAKDAAEAAARLKSEFLSMMSHEIRTPLNGVIGMTDLLLDTPLDAEQHELASLAKTSAQHLMTVINDILDFSKIEAGKLAIESIPFDFPRLVASSVDLVAAKAREKGLALSCVVDPEIPAYLAGDPVRLRQILLNFLGNAVKFTAQGKICLNATRESANDAAVRVRLEVTDSGIGIAPEALERLFKPFAQADTSTTRKYGGTGLGLSISKRLAELMGGEVGATSMPGHGATFWLRLDLAPAPPIGIAPALSPSPALPTFSSPSVPASVPEASAPHDDIRLLLAEDNAINQKLAARLLGKLGYRIDIANDGREALRLWQEGDYPLILMDVQMPEVDGFEATEHIRRMEAGGRRHTSIIAMTANAMSGDRERCLAHGMDDYLSKPIDPARLQAMLETWLPADGPRLQTPPAADIAPDMPSPFDMARLKDFFGDDEAAIEELLQVFATSLPTLKDRIGLALKERSAALKGAAHELKGSAANIGALALAHLAARLEALVVAADWSGADETFAAIEAEAGHIETFVRHRRPGMETDIPC